MYGAADADAEEQKEKSDAAKDDFHFVYKEIIGNMELMSKLEEN